MKINKIYLCLLFFGISMSMSNAQTASESLRYTELFPGGTARNVGVGGAMGSLGGDFGALSNNPAGLGVYRKSEFVISPALLLTNINSVLNEGEGNRANNSHFGLENIGLVFYKGYNNNKLKSFNFAAGINRLVNFNRRVEYNGRTGGSIVNSFVDDSQGLFLDDLDPFAGGIAADASAIFNIGGDDEWGSDFVDQNGFLFFDPIDREETITTTGGISEILLSLGLNISDKLYLGGSVNIPIVRFEEVREYRENDEDTDVIPLFRDLTFEQTLSTTGVGIGFKAGAIYRITNQIRVGASVHSPTRYSLSDDFTTSLNYVFIDNGSLQSGDGESPVGSFEYALTTPWRYSGGVSVVLRKLGFISLDIEFLDYTSSSFDLTVNGDNSVNQIAENNLNNEISTGFQNAINAKIGAEYLLGKKFRLRAGYGLFGNPFDSDDSGRNVLSLGAGFRGKSVYLDLAFNTNSSDEVYTPYNTFVDEQQLVTNDIGANNFLLTFGYRF